MDRFLLLFRTCFQFLTILENVFFPYAILVRSLKCFALTDVNKKECMNRVPHSLPLCSISFAHSVYASFLLSSTLPPPPSYLSPSFARVRALSLSILWAMYFHVPRLQVRLGQWHDSYGTDIFFIWMAKSKHNIEIEVVRLQYILLSSFTK